MIVFQNAMEVFSQKKEHNFQNLEMRNDVFDQNILGSISIRYLISLSKNASLKFFKNFHFFSHHFCVSYTVLNALNICSVPKA